jgi:hypothetical protein
VVVRKFNVLLPVEAWRLLIISLCVLIVAPVSAQISERPFILPLQGEPGLSTWLFGQAYGNTVGAYNNSVEWYSAGQGLHFGLDFPAPCGTPVVAVADGTVMHVDNFGFGSRPHNLLIRHDAVGLVSLYGHLLETPALVSGQTVKQGDVVGKSGDPDLTCVSRPHLHYELRSLDYRTAYNPIPYMNTNWHSLALVGGFDSQMFAQDLDNARRWMTLEDQPEVQFGGRRLNDYLAFSPPAPGFRPPTNPILFRELPPLSAGASVTLERIGYDQCCLDYWWHPTRPEALFTVDGAPAQRAMIFEWSVKDLMLTQNIGFAPRLLLSPDASHELLLVDGQKAVRRLSDGATWTVPVPPDSNLPGISPDNMRLFWLQRDSNVPAGQEQPNVKLFVSTIDGQNIKEIPAAPGTNATWLDEIRLLLMINQRPNTTIEIYNTVTDERITLGTWYRTRGLSVSPGGVWLTFYLANQDDPTMNSVYALKTEAGAQPQKLPFFGSWRWRDANSVYYVPFNPGSEAQQLAYYDLNTGAHLMLTDPAKQPFTIMNAKWEVSSDGSTLAFHNLMDRNLWLLRVQ